VSPQQNHKNFMFYSRWCRVTVAVAVSSRNQLYSSLHRAEFYSPSSPVQTFSLEIQ